MNNKHAPVTQINRTYPDNVVLISKTDPKGVITYVNAHFEQVSGFTHEQLLGKSHNIVRHPDMPPQVFKTMWQTLQAGHPWRGIIKNRCQNGDHYWVRANVAPILDSNGKIEGYVSVRRRPSEQEVKQAEAHYKRMKRGGAAASSCHARLRFANWSLKAKLQLLIQGILLLILTLGQTLFFNNIRDESMTLMHSQARQVANQLMDSANVLMLSGQYGTPDTQALMLNKLLDTENVLSATLLRAEPTRATFGNGLAFTGTPDALQRSALDSNTEQSELFRDADGAPRLRLITPYPASTDFHGTDCTSCHAVAPGTVLGALDLVLDLKPNFDRVNRMIALAIAGQIAVHLFLFFFIGFVVEHYVTRPVERIRGKLRDIMAGNLESDLDISILDDVGVLQGDIQILQTYLRTLLDDIVGAIYQMHLRIADMEGRVTMVNSNAQSQETHAGSIADTMHALSQSLAGVSDFSQASLQDSERMRSVVKENLDNIARGIEATSRVSGTMQGASAIISELEQAIGRIGNLSQSIGDIAEQTNMLALNAAIEAARAGEQGRGFAVVADEVRMLAERTSESTRGIARTIAEISAISHQATEAMASAVSEVEDGIGLIRTSDSGLQTIMASTDTVTELIGRIAVMAGEQSAASAQVENRLTQIRQLVDGNVAAAQQAKTASDELSHSAENLRHAGYPLTKCGL